MTDNREHVYLNVHLITGDSVSGKVDNLPQDKDLTAQLPLWQEYLTEFFSDASTAPGYIKLNDDDSLVDATFIPRSSILYVELEVY